MMGKLKLQKIKDLYIMKKNILFAVALTVLSLSSCQQKYSVIDNMVYLKDAEKTASKKLTINDEGAETVLVSRLGQKADVDVNVEYAIDPSFVDEYNRVNGTDYFALPEEYCSFSESKSTIKAGEINSAPVTLSIRPLDDKIDPSKKYAVPVSIVNSEGVETMKSSSSMVIILDQIITTSVLNLSKAKIGLTGNPLVGSYQTWTIEWLFNKYNLGKNNTNWNLKGADNKALVYTRTGDVGHPAGEFMIKVGTDQVRMESLLETNKWYHMAVVYDGSSFKFYLNGELQLTKAAACAGQTFDIAYIDFGNVKEAYNFNGYVSELRLWSVPRSQTEIQNNMYVVSPDSEGLEIYWKCNDGSGTTIHDYSGNERHGTLSSAETWMTDVKFPPQN